MVRKRGLEQASDDFGSLDAHSLPHENHGRKNAQHSLKERVAFHSNKPARPVEAQVQSRQNPVQSAKFTQGLHKDYTSPDGCDRPNDADMPDDLLDIIRAWPTLPTQVKNCIHALAAATAR